MSVVYWAFHRPSSLAASTGGLRTISPILLTHKNPVPNYFLAQLGGKLRTRALKMAFLTKMVLRLVKLNARVLSNALFDLASWHAELQNRAQAEKLFS